VEERGQEPRAHHAVVHRHEAPGSEAASSSTAASVTTTFCSFDSRSQGVIAPRATNPKNESPSTRTLRSRIARRGSGQRSIFLPRGPVTTRSAGTVMGSLRALAVRMYTAQASPASRRSTRRTASARTAVIVRRRSLATPPSRRWAGMTAEHEGQERSSAPPHVPQNIWPMSMSAIQNRRKATQRRLLGSLRGGSTFATCRSRRST
jgi:hypothetical protein